MQSNRSGIHTEMQKNIFPAVTEAGKAGDSLAQDFFREEYILNNTIGMFLTSVAIFEDWWTDFCFVFINQFFYLNSF